MNLGAIFIGLAILVVAIPYVMNPLLNERKPQPVKARHAQKEDGPQEKAILAAIRDLDFDFQTGKVGREDYEAERARLVLEAAGALQKRKQADDEIEALIRARSESSRARSQKTGEQLPGRCGQCGGALRPQDRFCPACGHTVEDPAGTVEPGTATCPGCGQGIQAADLFCTRCGTPLSVPAAG